MNHLPTKARSGFSGLCFTPAKKLSFKKRALLLFSLLTVLFYQGQNTLVNYQFENNLNADVGSIGTPVISLVNNADFTPYTANNGGNPGRALTTNTITNGVKRGGYIKLVINTTGYANINLSFDGYGSGRQTNWEVFANKNGNAPSFITTNNDYVSSLANPNQDWGQYSDVLSTTANTNFDNTNSITVYIVAYNNRLGRDRDLRIDNLKITGVSTAPCSGTPTGGTTVLTPATGLPSSTFVASTTGASGGTGLSYQWQIGDSATGPWTDISGETGATANLTATTSPSTTKFYRRRITCANGGAFSYSTAVSFITTAITYCTPSVSTFDASRIYIDDVKFLGSLVDDTDNPSLFSLITPGYANYTGVNPKAQQIPGGGINVYTRTVGTYISGGQATPPRISAWIDWNKNGDFTDAGEQIYDSGTGVESATFGFVVPILLPSTAIPTPIGDYRIRIRAANGNSNSCGSTTYGETEDYTFTVIDDCATKISSAVNGFTCGTGSATLSATGNGTSYRWYTTEFGGTAIAGATTATYNTPSISATTTYYVTAVNGTCESVKRYPVKAKVNPGTTITFANSQPDICGTDSEMILTSQGDKEENTLVTEDFEGGLVAFASSTITSTTAANDAKTQWQVQTSTMIPNLNTWHPAISSGLGANKFALATSDITNISGVDTALTLVSTINTTNFLNLKMDLDLYYSNYRPYINDDLIVEGSSNGGAWTAVQTINTIQGSGTRFAKLTLDLSSLISVTSLNIRIRYKTTRSTGTNGWGDGVAIDNIRIYGDKPFLTPLNWSATGINFFNTDCTTPLVGRAASVCIKPNLAQLETITSYTITGTATLQNGCTGTGSITIQNNTQIWNPASGTNWATATWKPDTAAPTAIKCIIVRKPVIINAATNGLGKNIVIESAGKLNINGSLTVTDWVKNNAAATDVVVESDGGLVQVNEGNTINTGNITAKRDVNITTGRQQYNYMMSPLEGQNLKTTYPGIDYVLYHNEANNFFYNSSGAYIKGRGLAVKEPNKTAVPTGTKVTATFTGYPTNGAFTFNMVNTNTSNLAKRGYNLVGNPYPSNLDLVALYNENGGSTSNVSNTYYLWDSRANTQTVMLGDGYGQQAYATFNASTPVGVGTGTMATGDFGVPGTNRPTQYVKVGQGFMAQAKVNNTPLVFNNKVRTTNRGTVTYLGKSPDNKTTAIDRYWLNLVTPDNVASQMAVVYFAEGHNDYTEDDSPAMGGSDAIYSLVDAQKVNIDGRSNFANTDVVVLGSAQYKAGLHTFVLADKEGIFANGQNIYLKDKETGIVTDLSQGVYNFNAVAGETTNRFEIVYKPEAVLVTNSAVKDQVIVYRDQDQFIIESPKVIATVEMYDASGKLMLVLQPNHKQTIIDASSLQNGIYMLHIKGKEGEVSNKKILK